MHMEKTGRDTWRIVVPVLALFAALAALGVFLVVGESKRSRIITEYEAARIASQLVESLSDQGFEEPEGLDQRVLGFGLYGARGNPMARWGDAPESMRGVAAKEVFAYDAAGRRLSLTRPLGMRMAAMADPSMRAARPRMGGMGRGVTGYLFLSLDIRDYFRRQGLLAAAAVAVPLAAAILAAVLIYLASSNARFRRAAAERETLARLGESARTLAHEIRNPLSAIRIQTGILRQALPGAEAAERSALDAIDEETERLNALSRRVGDFLKNPAGSPRRIDLGSFLADLAERSPHRPRYSSDGTSPFVSFDPELLRSSVENLLRNARESYGEAEGEVELELSTASGRRGPRAVVAIRDRGRGLAPEALEKAFDPFYSGKEGGFGIGLPLARGFVEAAGGELRLGPREGGGAEARIELPIAEGA
jgi:two-component system, NtrC family, sensor histidine kinase HydH